MSTGRKISAYIITISHIFAIAAIIDAVFFCEITVALKWLLASFVLYYVTGVQGITAGAHRLWAHRSYKASTPVRIWLMIMNTISNQGSIITWATDHRVHHIHVDTDADPHNINRGFFYAHMGWLYAPRTDAYIEAKKTVYLQDLFDDPVCKWQHDNYLWFAPIMCYLMPTVVAWWFTGEFWRPYIYLSHLRWIACLHATWNINSVSHYFGTRPYRPDLKATDNWFTSFFSGGEGWHNFHHAYPWDYCACENAPDLFWRFNGARFFIDLYAALGGVSARKIQRNAHRVPLTSPTECPGVPPHMRNEVLQK